MRAGAEETEIKGSGDYEDKRLAGHFTSLPCGDPQIVWICPAQETPASLEERKKW